MIASQIKEIIKPKVQLIDLTLMNGMVTVGDESVPPQAIHGNFYPLILVNLKLIEPDDIISMVIDSNGDIPILRLSIKVSSHELTGIGFIYDSEIVSVFMRSSDDSIKPIRNDFEILNAYYDIPNTQELGKYTLNIVGRLRLPYFYEEIQLYRKDTSYNVMKWLSSELGMGFASNVDNTEDFMGWINNSSVGTFIKNITKNSWKGSSSFFKSFVDNYYHINFIDVNKQLTLKNFKNPSLLSSDYYINNKSGDIFNELVENSCLTNYPEFNTRNIYIDKYDIINNSTLISNKKGYYNDVDFYDYTVKSRFKNLVDNNEISALYDNDIVDNKNHFPLRGNYKEKNIFKKSKNIWLDYQFSLPDGNVHKNYFMSEYHNDLNNKELEKLKLEITLPNINHNLYKYQKINVALFFYLNQKKAVLEKMQYSNKNLNSEYQITLNSTLSGEYIISGIMYYYNKSSLKISQKLQLIRREWYNTIIDKYN